VARDRQRAKRRRRAAQKGGSNPSRSRARDMGLDDPTIEESGLADTAPAPDPLKNISPDVDQAKAAEAGAHRGESGEVDLGESGAGEPEAVEEDLYGEDFERAPDELEEPEELISTRTRTTHGEERVQRERRERGRVITFLRACIDELGRVQWPDRRQVGQSTLVVLLFVIIAGGYLGLLDALWKPVVDAIL
jgi:preprotein translocase SecE subunit